MNKIGLKVHKFECIRNFYNQILTKYTIIVAIFKRFRYNIEKERTLIRIIRVRSFCLQSSFPSLFIMSALCSMREWA